MEDDVSAPPGSSRKAKEKELKKMKAAQKAEAAKAAQAEKAGQQSKKSEQKAKKSLPAAADNEADAVDPLTPSGDKKLLSPVMAKNYNPKAVEASWYACWEKSGFFVADVNSKKPPFVIVIPPPNVTGVLHIGHALMGAVEDTIVRCRRMSGYNTLWVPGCDHAGIATQVVVEKKIKKDRGLTRHDLGRKEFVAEVWKWKEQYGGRIVKQLRGIGASFDWSRECFTMDQTRSAAVTEAFVRLHKEKLIYSFHWTSPSTISLTHNFSICTLTISTDNRLVNWDCILKTAISDIEVDYIDIPGCILRRVAGYDDPVEFGVITSFAYPLEGGGEIVVATTGPEAMLGDTAVAVHPEDERYKHLHGKFVIHPFNNRRIPIICDAVLVDMNFGTGAGKITPAHDPNDFATGRRHNLEFINILTDDGKINSNGGKDWEGLRRFDARVAVLKSLTEKGLYRGVAENPMRIGVCSGTDDVVEPIIKPQWYVSCNDIAKEACAAVRNGLLEIVPKQFEDTWFRMTPGLINENPVIHETKSRAARKVDPDETKRDVIDAEEIFDHLRDITDPEHPYTLEQLNVVLEESISVDDEDNYVKVMFTPTVQHCGMATVIGLCIRVKLQQCLPPRFKVDIQVSPGSHATEEALNKQLSDKERVAAALENHHLVEMVDKCLASAEQ